MDRQCCMMLVVTVIVTRAHRGRRRPALSAEKSLRRIEVDAVPLHVDIDKVKENKRSRQSTRDCLSSKEGVVEKGHEQIGQWLALMVGQGKRPKALRWFTSDQDSHLVVKAAIDMHHR